MDQVQMEYWGIDIWKVNRFRFLNEEFEEVTSRCSQNLVNVRCPSHFKQKKLHTWLHVSCLCYVSCFWCMTS